MTDAVRPRTSRDPGSIPGSERPSGLSGLPGSMAGTLRRVMFGGYRVLTRLLGNDSWTLVWMVAVFVVGIRRFTRKTIG